MSSLVLGKVKLSTGPGEWRADIHSWRPCWLSNDYWECGE